MALYIARTPLRSGRTLIPCTPEMKMRPVSAKATLFAVEKSPYMKNAVPMLHIRSKPRYPFLNPAKKQEDSLYSSTKDTDSTLKDLQAQVKTLEDQLKKVTQERDKLMQHQKANNSKVPNLGKVYRALWKRLLHSQRDQKTIKTMLLEELKGTTRIQAEVVLKELGLKGKETAALLDSLYQDSQFDAEKFSAGLKKYQPIPLYEDIQLHIQQLCRHFALRNLSRTDFETTFRSHLPASCPQETAITCLTSPDFGLPTLVAKRVVNYLWKGELSMQVKELELEELPEWERLEDVVKRARLHLATNNQHLWEVPKHIPIPLTAERLEKALIKDFGLNPNQSGLLTAYLFPESSARPISTLSDMLAPAWMTPSELEIPKRLEELANYMDEDTLCQIGEMTTAVNSQYISLSEFETRCEQTFQTKLTNEQRAALELFCFEKTDLPGALCFSALFSAISAERSKMLEPLVIAPTQAFDIE